MRDRRDRAQSGDVATLAELQTTLAAYKAERDKLLAGRVAEVQIGEHRYSLLNIGLLERLIAQYERRTARKSGYTGFSVVKFGSPR